MVRRYSILGFLIVTLTAPPCLGLLKRPLRQREQSLTTSPIRLLRTFASNNPISIKLCSSCPLARGAL